MAAFEVYEDIESILLTDRSWHTSGVQNLTGFVSEWVAVFKSENLVGFRSESVVDFIEIRNG
jgi:hypothetical protein